MGKLKIIFSKSRIWEVHRSFMGIFQGIFREESGDMVGQIEHIEP
jgi:hypothetical protein